jgi:epsilon-lactone hydrolase
VLRPYNGHYARRVPSLVHHLLTHVIPVVRRSSEVGDPEEVRRTVLALQRNADPSPPRRGLRGCSVTEVEGQPFPVFDLRPPGPEPTRTVLYLHGGGFVGEVDPFHWRYAARLARATGARLVLPAYPLAPTHTWRDTDAPLLGLFERLAVESPHGVSLMGDSAGGGLALATAQRLARLPGPQPTKLVLLAPWVDLAGETPGTEEARGRDPWLKLTKLRLYGTWWAGDDDLRRPEVSPLHGDFAGLPRTLVFCGTRDLLLPQVRETVRRARAAGVTVGYHEAPGLLHVYPILPVPEARSARRETAEFLGAAQA